jgi:hypothetical protein
LIRNNEAQMVARGEQSAPRALFQPATLHGKMEVLRRIK